MEKSVRSGFMLPREFPLSPVGHASLCYREAHSTRTRRHAAVRERFIGTLRRELLTRGIIFGERHFLNLLREYIAYYNAYRPHLTLNKDSPFGRAILGRPCDESGVVSIPRVGGLQHHYEWSAKDCDDDIMTNELT